MHAFTGTGAGSSSFNTQTLEAAKSTHTLFAGRGGDWELQLTSSFFTFTRTRLSIDSCSSLNLFRFALSIRNRSIVGILNSFGMVVQSTGMVNVRLVMLRSWCVGIVCYV